MLITDIEINTGRRRTDVKDEKNNTFWVEYAPGRITVNLMDRYENARKNKAVDIHLLSDTLFQFMTDWDIQHKVQVSTGFGEDEVETFEEIVETMPITIANLKTIRMDALSLILNSILEDLNKPEPGAPLGEKKGTNSRPTSKRAVR